MGVVSPFEGTGVRVRDWKVGGKPSSRLDMTVGIAVSGDVRARKMAREDNIVSGEVVLGSDTGRGTS